MSSATSIDEKGFRPWHFFVLASLMLATVAVIMSRQSTPEHLVFISFTIAAAGAAAAGLYRTCAPLASRDVSLFRPRVSERSRASLEREKTLVLRSIKELEFDRAMGKLSDQDFQEMGGRLRARAISLLKQLDDDGAGYRILIERELQARLRVRTAAGDPARPVTTPAFAGTSQSAAACSCGLLNDPDAVFCKRCGLRLPEGVVR